MGPANYSHVFVTRSTTGEEEQGGWGADFSSLVAWGMAKQNSLVGLAGRTEEATGAPSPLCFSLASELLHPSELPTAHPISSIYSLGSDMFIQTLGAKHAHFFFFFFQSGTSYFSLRETARKGRANITPRETTSPLVSALARTSVLEVCKTQTTDVLWKGEVSNYPWPCSPQRGKVQKKP